MTTASVSPTRVWLDTETTDLDPLERRAWEIAAIVRRPGQPDTEYQWFVDVSDLALRHANPKALEVGGFWQRHPQAALVALPLPPNHPLAGANLPTVPPTGKVVGEYEALKLVAELTAGRAVVCGSFPAFDTHTLHLRMLAYGIEPTWHYHPDDTPGIARGWLLGRDLPAPRKSDEIARACGINPDRYERHTALGDCRLFRDLSDVIEPRTDLITA